MMPFVIPNTRREPKHDELREAGKSSIAMPGKMDPDGRCMDPIENEDVPASYVSLPEGYPS